MVFGVIWSVESEVSTAYCSSSWGDEVDCSRVTFCSTAIYYVPVGSGFPRGLTPSCSIGGLPREQNGKAVSWVNFARRFAPTASKGAFHSTNLFLRYIKVYKATKWTIKHSLRLLWFKYLITVTEKLQFRLIGPMIDGVWIFNFSIKLIESLNQNSIKPCLIYSFFLVRQKGQRFIVVTEEGK